MNAIKRAVDTAGGISALARALGVSYQAVKFWIDGKRRLEPIRCVQIEQFTDGAVTRQELRPDDWWELWPELAYKNPAAAGRAARARAKAAANA